MADLAQTNHLHSMIGVVKVMLCRLLFQPILNVMATNLDGLATATTDQVVMVRLTTVTVKRLPVSFQDHINITGTRHSG